MIRPSTIFAAAILAALTAGAGGCTGDVSPEARQLLQNGKAALESGDRDAALRDLNLFLKDNSSSRLAGEAYYYRGRTRLAGGDLPGARADLTQAAGLLQDNLLAAQALLTLGELAEQAGDLPAAQRLYRQSVEKLPLGQKPADEGLFRLGCALQREGRWGEADLPFDRLIFLFGDDPMALEAQKKVRATAWTIRAAMLPQRPAAVAAAEALTKAGLPASVGEILDGGRLNFVVDVGRYATYAQAAAALSEVRGKAGDAAIVETR